MSAYDFKAEIANIAGNQNIDKRVFSTESSLNATKQFPFLFDNKL